MTSRERLLRAVRLQPVDRVPISTFPLVPFADQGFRLNGPSYQKLNALVEEKTDCFYHWGFEVMCNAREEEFTEQIVWREGDSAFTKTILHTPLGDLTSLVKRDEGVHTKWIMEHPIKSPEDMRRFLSVPYETRKDPSIFDQFKRMVEKQGDKGIVYTDIGDPVGWAEELMGFETFAYNLMCEKDATFAFMDAMFERQFDALHYALDGGIGELFRISGPEIAAPPLMGPQHFRELALRYDPKFIDLIHQHSQMVCVHCHGNVKRIMDSLLEMGADVIEPVEPPPDGDISLREAKAMAQGKVCLMGNLEFRELEAASPERIDELVKQIMDEAKDGYGFIIMPSAHPIVEELPAKTETNYIQYIESALAYGKY